MQMGESTFEQVMQPVLDKWQNELPEYHKHLHTLLKARSSYIQSGNSDELMSIDKNIHGVQQKIYIIEEMISDLKSVLNK
jgi:hypothetical protein